MSKVLKNPSVQDLLKMIEESGPELNKVEGTAKFIKDTKHIIPYGNGVEGIDRLYISNYMADISRSIW